MMKEGMTKSSADGDPEYELYLRNVKMMTTLTVKIFVQCARRMSSSVPTASVLMPHGTVMATTTVAMSAMNTTAVSWSSLLSLVAVL